MANRHNETKIESGNNVNCLERKGKEVSVVISTYNRSFALYNAIKSVQKQTVRNIEILVCDDGSTDDTKSIVTELKQSDQRIVYLDCGHSGRPAVPRNKGISVACGEWIAFLDDDDIWEPDKLEKQLNVLTGSNMLACCTNAYIIRDGKSTSETYFDNSGNRFIKYKVLVHVNPIICSSMIIHHSLLRYCKGFPEEMELRAIEDYALWHRVSANTTIIYLDCPLVGYSICSSTSIRLDKKETFDQQKNRIMIDFLDWLSNQPRRIKLRVKIEGFKDFCIINSRKIASKLKILNSTEGIECGKGNN